VANVTGHRGIGNIFYAETFSQQSVVVICLQYFL